MGTETPRAIALIDYDGRWNGLTTTLPESATAETAHRPVRLSVRIREQLTTPWGPRSRERDVIFEHIGALSDRLLYRVLPDQHSHDQHWPQHATSREVLTRPRTA